MRRINRFTVIDYQRVGDGVVQTGSGVIPFDDTIPQNTEGDEYYTLTHYPAEPENKIIITTTLQLYSTNNRYCTIALFKNNDVNAVAALNDYIYAARLTSMFLTHEYDVTKNDILNGIVWRVRAASTAGAMTINGYAGSRRLGGVASSFISIMELAGYE